MDQTTTRRGFLRLAGGTAVAPAACAAIGQFSALLAAATPAGEDYWNMVRRQFAFGEDKVPMNAANLCPSPRVVAERVAELTRDIDGDCSFQNRARLAALLESSRAKVAGQLGVTADEIALVRNTSEANNAINSGLPLKAGDEIVLWDQNHPTNNVAWDVRAARFGLAVHRVSTPAAPASTDQLVRTFTDALTPKTRVLALTHVSNVSGLALPVKEICDEARRRGVYVHVDGAQSWGALEVDLRELGCDSYSASAHKWFVGPKEVGLLYVRRERIGEIWPSVVAPGWGNAVEPEVKGARKFESLGQRDDAALAAIATAADFHSAIGPARAAARVVELASMLKNGLKEAGLELVTPPGPARSGGVCVVRVRADRREDVYQKLYAQHGIAGAATGGLRLCPHFYNTREHIERALAGIKSLLG
jgi:selenocysteine lyase/cysteine desulfurase